MQLKNLIFKIAFAVYIGLAVFRLTDPTLKWVKEKPIEVKYQSQAPTNIKIAKINLDIAISPSVVTNNNWQLFDDRAAWLSTSAFPGKGNTIIYAHDRTGLFSGLKNIKRGDEIEIYNGEWTHYEVTEVHSVKPTDVSSVLSQKNRLTLFTCDGSFDQKRLVVYAE